MDEVKSHDPGNRADSNASENAPKPPASSILANFGTNLAPKWAPGQSGNPGGRPKLDRSHTRRARQLTGPMLDGLEVAYDRMRRIVEDPKGDNMEAIGAARTMKDIYETVSTRALGRPREKPAVDGEDVEGPELDAQLDAVIERLRRRAREVVVDVEAVEVKTAGGGT